MEEQGRSVKRNGRLLALIIALCVFLSAGLGLGFGALGYKLMEGGSADTGRNSVIYNSGKVNITATGENNAVTASDVIAAVADTVVEIRTESVGTGSYLQQVIVTGAGSGVIISEDGTIVTNNHVIDGARKITVTLRSGETYDASLLATDAKTDIAVIQIEAQGLTSAVFGDSSALRVGDDVIAIGNPLGQLGGSASEGIISALDRAISVEGQTMTLLQTTAAINPGNSGGGLFNMEGMLVGIVNAKSTGEDVEGLGFAIPSNTALKISTDLLTYGYVPGRIDTGLDIVEITDAYTLRVNGLSMPGLYVRAVTGNQASAFQVKDRIISMNEMGLTTAQELNDFLDGCKVGDVLNVVVMRGNQQKLITLTLSELIPA